MPPITRNLSKSQVGPDDVSKEVSINDAKPDSDGVTSWPALATEGGCSVWLSMGVVRLPLGFRDPARLYRLASM